jgi:hypothetical protein
MPGGSFHVVPISPLDVKVIGSILIPYEQYIRFTVPPSAKRGLNLLAIENLRVRIARFSQKPREGSHLLLTFADLALIDEAIQSFISNLRQFAPPSKPRAETIESCEKLRLFLRQSFPPGN